VLNLVVMKETARLIAEQLAASVAENLELGGRTFIQNDVHTYCPAGI
jgi:hypothetical protein